MKQCDGGQYHISRVAHFGGIYLSGVFEGYAQEMLAPTNIVAMKIIAMKVLIRGHAEYHLCGMVLMNPWQQPGNHAFVCVSGGHRC
jgi:hypothetical protein